jgi:23S rRNA (guanine2445-N2)-methyltransferase / 23S rRNA (guanine2069-N7)-methyltransferase
MKPDVSQQTSYEFFATCAKGAEKMLAQELSQLADARARGQARASLAAAQASSQLADARARASSQLADARARARRLKIRPLNSGVVFFGTLEDAYRALLHLFCASRVLLVLARVDATDADQLYARVRALPWEEHVPNTGTIAVDARGTNESLRDTRFVAQKVKDAVCDRLLDLNGKRPSVERNRPDVRLNVSLHGSRATVALDLAGEPLHRRGYRMPSAAITAPLRETLAATMLMAGGWGTDGDGGTVLFCQHFEESDELRKHEQMLTKQYRPPVTIRPPDTPYLLDPLCGSGTIPIEAALMLSGRAPGILRDYWGFEGWLGHDAELWASLLDDADEEAEAALDALSSEQPVIFASDVDAAAVAVARESARRAGVAELIRFETIDVAHLRLSDQQRAARGLLVTNPPYGERLASRSQLPALYAALGRLETDAPQGLDAVVITPDDRVNDYLGGVPAQRIDAFNGPLETAIRIWPGQKGDINEPSPFYSQAEPTATAAADPDALPFINRLRKMATHRGKWARRANIGCYRVYDADLPDYAVAIDRYQGADGTPDEGQCWLHIAEYAPPAHIDEQKANARLATALLVAPEVLEIPTANVFFKQRRRSKGGEQYGQDENTNSQSREAEKKHSHAVHLIREDGLVFEVDFASRLDTGIFLDHRMTRALLRQHAHGADCLNLFAYTGTASAYMAAGGAHSVTTVDLSPTYLDWAQRNMKRNRFMGEAYRFEQADASAWAQEHRHDKEKYGLIFVDPPTFSNSARMGRHVWEVQRDHAELLIALSRMLAPDGMIVFSCNLRGFKPDSATLAKARVAIEDITARTIPPDFERNPKIHHCYLLTRI